MFNSQEKTQNKNIRELKVNISPPPPPPHFGCNILSKKREITPSKMVQSTVEC